MPKCANCGTELDEGAKFCLECGTPVPQTKKCIKCGFELPLSAKFCPECGTKQDGQSNPNAGGSGLSMGDKNVIAGDVIGHKEETHIAGNATIIKNEDQTKQVKKCHICGSIVPIVDGFDCPECHQFTCASCFDSDAGCCNDCVEQLKKRNEEAFKSALKMAYADGRIEYSERQQLITLQHKLKISDEKAKKLEQQFRGDTAEALTTTEKLSIEQATKLYCKEGNYTEALNLIKPIFENHQTREEVLNLYLPLLAEIDSEQALSFINSMQVDILMAYITAIDIALKNDDLNEAELKYKQAARIWPENALVKCYQVLLNYAFYKKFKKQDFLNKAKEIVEDLGEAQNELELSMQVRVQMFMQEATGEILPEITKQFCEDNQLYWAVMNKQLFEDCFKVQASEAADFISKLNSEKCTIEISGKITEEQRTKLRESLIDKKDCKIALDLSNCSFEDCNPYFRDCTGLTSITIPDSVTEIEYATFSGCTGLTSINIPNSVTELGGDTFSGCTGLTSIKLPDSVTTIGSFAFGGCTGLTSINIPESVTTIGDEAFSGCTGLTSMTIPNSVTTIGVDAFRGCTGLTSINIPDSVTTIGVSAFSGCTGLTSINIPDSVTTIGKYAFSGCTGLTSIKLPDSVTEIVEFAFKGCTGLTSINIPDSVTKIGGYAFKGCTGLTSINIPNSVTELGYNAFSGCTGLTSINIPNSVTEFGGDTFSGCTGLTSVNIPNSVTTIDAFSGCTGLTSINIPNSVTELGYNAFSGCTGLTSINIPNSVTEFGGDAFSDCTGLTSINIPDSVTTIGVDAFNGCTGLTSINIPESITTIEEGTFSNCTSLINVSLPDSITNIYVEAFTNCPNLKTITIPKNCEVDDDAFDEEINIIRR